MGLSLLPVGADAYDRRPNFGTKFGALVMGIGPYALRGAAPRGVVPYGWLRRAAAIALGSGA